MPKVAGRTRFAVSMSLNGLLELLINAVSLGVNAALVGRFLQSPKWVKLQEDSVLRL
jgi:hypothetical protein